MNWVTLVIISTSAPSRPLAKNGLLTPIFPFSSLGRARVCVYRGGSNKSSEAEPQGLCSSSVQHLASVGKPTCRSVSRLRVQEKVLNKVQVPLHRGKGMNK